MTPTQYTAVNIRILR